MTPTGSITLGFGSCPTSGRSTARSRMMAAARQAELRAATEFRAAIEKARMLQVERERGQRPAPSWRCTPPATSRSTKMGVESYVVRCKLKMRKSSELDSDEAGELPTSSIVSILEQKELEDGTQRAQIGWCGSTAPLGWVSCLSKDGRNNLIAFHWTRFQRFRPPLPPAQSPLTADQTSTSSLAPAALPPQSSVPSAEHASGAAVNKARRVSISKATSPRQKAITDGGDEKQSSERQGNHAKAGSRALPVMQKVNVKVDGSVAANERALLQVDKEEQSKKRTVAAAERMKPQSAAELGELIAQMEAEIETEKRSLGAGHNTLQMRLGEALFKSGTKVTELVKTWATNSKGVATGEVSRMDFRKHVRKVVDWPNVKQVDAYFNEIDTNKGGTLDQKELEKAIKKLQDKAQHVAVATQEVERKCDFIRSRIATAQEVISHTERAEDAMRRLEQIQSNKAPAAKLGAELLKRGTKISDLLKSWESANGEVDVVAFRNNVRDYGVNDTDEALDDLFHTLDADGGGTLDIDELKGALGGLREASQEADKEVERLKKKSVELWKAAKVAQLELKKQRRMDEAAAKAKEEQAAREALEREAAAKAAIEERAARAEALKRKKAEDQAAYEAKIHMRRQSASGNLSTGIKMALGI